MRAVLVTGSRHWSDLHPIVDAIMAIDPNLIIEGGADGADFHARTYASQTGSGRLTWPDDHWGGYATGPTRNGYMVQVAAALQAAGWDVTVLAFPAADSRGTWDCVRKAQAAGLNVVIHDKETPR